MVQSGRGISRHVALNLSPLIPVVGGCIWLISLECLTRIAGIKSGLSIYTVKIRPMIPKQYQTWCWHFIDETLKHDIESSFIENSRIFIKGDSGRFAQASICSYLNNKWINFLTQTVNDYTYYGIHMYRSLCFLWHVYKLTFLQTFNHFRSPRVRS